MTWLRRWLTSLRLSRLHRRLRRLKRTSLVLVQALELVDQERREVSSAITRIRLQAAREGMFVAAPRPSSGSSCAPTTSAGCTTKRAGSFH